MPEILFKLLILILPLPATLILYRFLGTHKNDFHGNILGKIKIHATGPVAAYISIFCLLQFSIFPSNFGLNLNSEKTKWEFKLIYSLLENKNQKTKYSGTLTFINDPGKSIKIIGRYDEDLPLGENIWRGKGLYDGNNFFFPLSIPNIKQPLLAIGSREVNNDDIVLSIFSRDSPNYRKTFSLWNDALKKSS